MKNHIRGVKKSKRKKTTELIQYVDVSKNSFFNTDRQTYAEISAEEKEDLIPDETIYEPEYEDYETVSENNDQ